MIIIKHTGHETNTSCIIDSMKRHSLWCALCQHQKYTIIDETHIFMANVIREARHSRHIVTFSPLFLYFFALQQKNFVSLLVASLSVSLLSSLPAPVWRTEADWALRGVSMGKPFLCFQSRGKISFPNRCKK